MELRAKSIIWITEYKSNKIISWNRCHFLVLTLFDSTQILFLYPLSFLDDRFLFVKTLFRLIWLWSIDFSRSRSKIFILIFIFWSFLVKWCLRSWIKSLKKSSSIHKTTSLCWFTFLETNSPWQLVKQEIMKTKK